MGKYGKAVFAFLYIVATVVVSKWTGDNHIDPVEGAIIATAVVTNAGVWLVPLAPSAKWTKTAVGALTAGLAVVEVVILDHAIDANEALLIVSAVAGALGIAVAPALSTITRTAAGPAAVGWGKDR